MQGFIGSTSNVQPVGPPSAYQSFVIAAPPTVGRDFWRVASCAEVGCQRRRDGWMTVCDEATDLGRRQAHYIRTWSERRFEVGSLEITDTEAGLGQRWSPVARPDSPTVFKFHAGQDCFEEHKVRTGRPGIYLVRNGDFRAGPKVDRTVIRRYDRDDQWVHDFACHQTRLIELQERG